KLDYWLIGQGNGVSPWANLCRFDGSNFLWEPLKVPAATLAKVPVSSTGARTGGITSGTCFTWDNCWFFGTFGVVVHWDGTTLAAATPNLTSSPWLAGTIPAAVAQHDAAGNGFGEAVGVSYATTLDAKQGVVLQPLPVAPATGTPAQLFTSDGTSWTPV